MYSKYYKNIVKWTMWFLIIKVGKCPENKGFLDNVSDKVFLRWEVVKTLENVGLEGDIEVHYGEHYSLLINLLK